MTTPRDILDFWFSPQAQALWFEKVPAFDDQIRTRFAAAIHEAQQGGFETWRQSPEGSLALLILLDQFARNIHRDSAKAFLGDSRARTVAATAIERGFDQRLPFLHRRFIYLPFEHSEAMADQDRAIALFGQWLDQALPSDRDEAAEQLHDAHLHRDVIVRFGRFPHRNDALGRDTTEAEAAFLRQPNSSF
ncbi:DUF924 family protein [Dongia soli]|uniref:DUF924 family protein n=1 Tax=Dongia soli TaxID=600628 RepID=A0ABU5E775_9PROT|nr:DUF924 family protein [Dongia soli]MDY0882160.1 DUF924 family protein [Dongia soli]